MGILYWYKITWKKQWKMGRIIDVIRGADNEVRGAKLRTTTDETRIPTVITPPLQRMYLFKINNKNIIKDEEDPIWDFRSGVYIACKCCCTTSRSWECWCIRSGCCCTISRSWECWCIRSGCCCTISGCCYTDVCIHEFVTNRSRQQYALQSNYFSETIDMNWYQRLHFLRRISFHNSPSKTDAALTIYRCMNDLIMIHCSLNFTSVTLFTAINIPIAILRKGSVNITLKIRLIL